MRHRWLRIAGIVGALAIAVVVAAIQLHRGGRLRQSPAQDSNAGCAPCDGSVQQPKESLRLQPPSPECDVPEADRGEAHALKRADQQISDALGREVKWGRATCTALAAMEATSDPKVLRTMVLDSALDTNIRVAALGLLNRLDREAMTVEEWASVLTTGPLQTAIGNVLLLPSESEYAVSELSDPPDAIRRKLVGDDEYWAAFMFGLVGTVRFGVRSMEIEPWVMRVDDKYAWRVLETAGDAWFVRDLDPFTMSVLLRAIEITLNRSDGGRADDTLSDISWVVDNGGTVRLRREQVPRLFECLVRTEQWDAALPDSPGADWVKSYTRWATDAAVAAFVDNRSFVDWFVDWASSQADDPSGWKVAMYTVTHACLALKPDREVFRMVRTLAESYPDKRNDIAKAAKPLLESIRGEEAGVYRVLSSDPDAADEMLRLCAALTLKCDSADAFLRWIIDPLVLIGGIDDHDFHELWSDLFALAETRLNAVQWSTHEWRKLLYGLEDLKWRDFERLLNCIPLDSGLAEVVGTVQDRLSQLNYRYNH